ncbi:hypothetical protein [Luteimicrobium album]|uniref:hypothetical protein n=1 Tax=Luteimicrobium album TaxID=1054550 RepID=UPI0024E170A8|nr:hypothetical protein [Luteimicrobium album]
MSGRGVDPELVQLGNFYVDGGFRHGVELLSRPDRHTAVFGRSTARPSRRAGGHIPAALSRRRPIVT